MTSTRRRLAGLAAALALGALIWKSNLITPDTDAFTDTWIRPDGQPAERGQGRNNSYEITAFTGSDHCQWQSVVFLNVPWPLGSTDGPGRTTQIRQYHRDADGALHESFQVPAPDLDAQLPPDATYTGYHNEHVQLWFGNDRGERYAYLVHDDVVERWPRTPDSVACA